MYILEEKEKNTEFTKQLLMSIGVTISNFEEAFIDLSGTHIKKKFLS